MTAKFWVGAQSDAELEPKHIGQTIMLEHFSYVGGSDRDQTYALNVHVGILAGFTEMRGRGVYRLEEIGYQGDGRIEYPDLSLHDSLTLVVVFQDGAEINVREKDFGSVWIHDTKEATR